MQEQITAKLSSKRDKSLSIGVQKGLKITTWKVHTRNVCGVRFDTLGDLVGQRKRVHRTADVFVQGCEIDHKSEFSALLRHKARRGAKL